MDSPLRELATTADVIDTLDRVGAVALLTGRTTNAVHNWKAFGRFPSNTFVVMQEALRAKGCTAPASLWGMVSAPESAEAAE